MATIVMHNQTLERYVYLGAGYGTSEYAVPGKQVPGDKWWKMEPKIAAKETPMIAVCDSDGRIVWMPAAELTVVTIDGQTAHQILSSRALR